MLHTVTYIRHHTVFAFLGRNLSLVFFFFFFLKALPNRAAGTQANVRLHPWAPPGLAGPLGRDSAQEGQAAGHPSAPPRSPLSGSRPARGPAPPGTTRGAAPAPREGRSRCRPRSRAVPRRAGSGSGSGSAHRPRLGSAQP